MDLHNDINKMSIGKPLPKVKLQNSKRDVINSASLELGNKTVLYFWSQTQMNQYRNTLDRISDLQKKYPKLNL